MRGGPGHGDPPGEPEDLREPVRDVEDARAALGAPGHTPGHVVFLLTAAASERVKWLVSDLPVRPGAEYVYDALAEAGVAENRALPESLAIYDAIFRGREDFVYRITIGELA